MSASLHSPSGRAAGMTHNVCHTRNTVELCVCYAVGCHSYIRVTHQCRAPSTAVNETHCRWRSADASAPTSGSALWQWLWHLEASLFVRVCVCQGSSQHHGIQSSLSYSHTLLCLSYPVSANTDLIWILSVLLLFGVKSQRSSRLFATNTNNIWPDGALDTLWRVEL